MSRISRWLRRHRAASTRPVFSVQLLRPCGRPSDYDVVALPRHDLQRPLTRRWIGTADNVAVTTGAVNTITPARLAEAATVWEERLRPLPTPRLAVLVGGDSRHRPLPFKQTLALVDSLLAWAKTSGGSLMITTSRRSGAPISGLIETLLKGQQNAPFRFWRPDDPACGENPYLGFLAHADAVVATDDSISMVSEGMTAGKPVYLFGDEARLPPKFRAFFDRMAAAGRLARWRGNLTLTVPAEALNDAAVVAEFVRARWNTRRKDRDHSPPGAPSRQVKAYFINLDASIDRRTHMDTELRRAGMAFERVAGIRGSALPPDLIPYFHEADGRPASAMTFGEIGCHAAHIAACRRFLDDRAGDPSRIALMLEDDVRLPADLAGLLDVIISKLPFGWDIVRLSNTPKRAYVPIARIGNRFLIVQYSRIPTCSSAYLVNVTGARKLSALGLRRHPIDIHLRRPWFADLNSYGIFPAPVELTTLSSNIDAVQERTIDGERRQPWGKRLGFEDLPLRLKFEIKCFGFWRWLALFAINAADKVPRHLFGITIIHFNRDDACR